jgi:hypothetical protein
MAKVDNWDQTIRQFRSGLANVTFKTVVVGFEAPSARQGFANR